jgi:hypothetical protein
VTSVAAVVIATVDVAVAVAVGVVDLATLAVVVVAVRLVVVVVPSSPQELIRARAATRTGRLRAAGMVLQGRIGASAAPDIDALAEAGTKGQTSRS